MYKLLSHIFLILSTLFMTSMVFATPDTCIANADGSMPNATDFLQRCSAGTMGISPSNSSDKAGIRERVAKIAERAISIGIILTIGFIVWSGIQYTTAYGDDEKLKHAKSTAIFAIGGLLLLLLAFGFVDIFLNFIYSLQSS